jgi:hypothetical protein
LRKQTALAAILFVTVVGIPSLAAAAIISIAPTSEEIANGNTFTVDINIGSVTDLYGYQFDVSFNSTILQAVSSSEGSFLTTVGSTYFVPGTNDNSNGLLGATADTLLSAVPGVSGSGTLATLTFQAIGSGTSTLSLGNVQLLDSSLNLIDGIASNGSITVAPVPLPAAAPLLLLGLCGIGALVGRQSFAPPKHSCERM